MSVKVCKNCGVQIPWEGSDDCHGRIWGCDECMEYFCEKCFSDRHGQKALEEMLCNESRRILCPECYKRSLRSDE